MPGCSPVQIVPASEKVSAPFSQRTENTGFLSFSPSSRTTTAPTRSRSSGGREPANLAGRDAANAWRQRFADWMETILPRASADLLPRLPFEDAVKLAALVGTGRMSWPEVNAALDAMIKLAVANDLDGQPLTRSVPVCQIAEDEIRARYHAQCDELFAKDASTMDSGAPSREELWRTERLLDRMRSARDRELAALRRRRIYAQPAMPWTDLAPAESAALHKLDRTGFAASEGMIEAIDSLVGEIVKNMGDVV